MSGLSDSDSTASQALLAAALGGLLGLTACGGGTFTEPDGDPATSSGGSLTTSTTPGRGCTNEVADPKTTSSTPNVPDPGEDAFKAQCAAAHGTFEVMPHCGGFATGRGFSYDRTTETSSEHSCRGANTCGGYNCVVCDDAT